MDKQGLEGTSIQGSWIPNTPFRPILPEPAQIYSDMQENEAQHANQSESERDFSVQTMSGLEHLPFGDLLALANAASAAFAGAAPWAYHGNFRGSCLSGLNSKINCCGVEVPSVAFSYADPELSNGLDSGYGTSEKLQCGLPATLQGMENTISQRSCTEFAPITPEKPIGREGKHFSEGTYGEQNEPGNEAEATRPSSNREQFITENQELASADALVPAEENNDPGKGGSQGTEHMNTPEKPKRRKHRPKVVTEAKPKKTPKPRTRKLETPIPADGKDKPTGKRKYVRKKGLKDSTLTPAEAGRESADAEILNPAKKSCRRALNFEDDGNNVCKSASNLDSEAQGQGCCNREDQSKSDIHLADGIEAMADKTQAEIASDLAHSGNQTSKECTPEGQAPSTPLPTKSKPRQRKRNPRPQKEPKENGKNPKTVHGSVAQFLPQIGNSIVNLTEERQARKSRMENLRVIDQVDAIGTNLLGVQYNSVQEYQKFSWLYFPNKQKNKRNLKVQNSVMSQSEAQMDLFAPKPNYCIHTQSGTNEAPTRVVDQDLLTELHVVESTTSLNKKEKLTRKRSRSNTHARKLASLNRILKGDAHSTDLSGKVPAEYDSRPQTSIESIISEQSTLSKKKRTKKSKELQTQQRIILQQYQFSASSAGFPPDELWRQLFSIDAISERLRLLDINRESAYIPYQETALVPHTKKTQEQNALVLYRGHGTIVPSEGPFFPVRKRRPRPRVDLDNETNRVWKLLMGNINSEGIDGTDEQKEKWWEEERRVFKGRADSFIARMHLVQGDRRFTPWKGSVVDSVIGVFLTQNVSDHLSSSAFMSLAARFPLQSNCNIKPEEGGSSMPHEPLVYLDSEESMSNPQACDQSSITLDNIQHNEEKEVVNIDETSRNSSEIVSPTNETICKVVSSSGSTPDTCYNSNAERINIIGREPTCLIRVSREATHGLLPSQDSVASSQQFPVSVTIQNTEKTGLFSESNSEGEDPRKSFKPSYLNAPTSFMELLQMAGSSMLQGQGKHTITSDAISIEEHFSIQTNEHDNQRLCIDNNSPKSSIAAPTISPGNYSLQFSFNQGESEVESFNSFRGEGISSNESNEPSCSCREDRDVVAHSQTEIHEDPRTIQSKNQVENKQTEQHVNSAQTSRAIPDVTDSTDSLGDLVGNQLKPPDPDLREQGNLSSQELNQVKEATPRSKGRKVTKEKKDEFDWDTLRREVEGNGGKRERTARTMDTVDWEVVRTTDVDEIAKTIKDRGMNNVLAGRMQDFLNRLVREHGSIDLEWLRDIPPDKAKEYLLSIRGLGLKSVECVRLLTLHHLAFPVDTNVGRIAVRLGWVPLQPLPESLQLHLLELYPVLESIQKYLWPRLCKLDQRTLYELHYQMITFGKVFCTKSKPNCNACPMRGECRHFASAFASARLALPGPEEKSIVGANENGAPDPNPPVVGNQGLLSLPQSIEPLQGGQNKDATKHSELTYGVTNCEPIIEEPATPEPECMQVSEHDIEDAFFEDPEEIPTIRLNMDAFTNNLKNYMQQNMELQEGDMSKALVALTTEAASIPMPKLKNVSQLRTEHQVYELPDSHPLLEGSDKREPDDPCSYLLAIWTPGETAESIKPPDRKCSSQENGNLCDEETCFSCNNIREARSQTVRGTLLIPCRTAMKGSFPLNGTYFQVNEVFADHDSSLSPIDIPRDWIWNLPRKTVYFGTSIPTIFKGLTTEGIQHCFWRGYVCVRGFDQKTRAPRPLMARLHFPASKLSRTKGETNAGGA